MTAKQHAERKRLAIASAKRNLLNRFEFHECKRLIDTTKIEFEAVRISDDKYEVKPANLYTFILNNQQGEPLEKPHVPSAELKLPIKGTYVSENSTWGWFPYGSFLKTITESRPPFVKTFKTKK